LRTDRFARVDEVVRAGAGSQFTAAVARVEARGRLLFECAYGVTRLDDPAPVFVDTRFDLASLTKLFVSSIALMLVGEGRLALDMRVAEYLPEWRDSAHAPITLRMLLAHTSGMRSGADFRALLNENVERFALRCPLVVEPGMHVIYSDLGMIALGVLLERSERCALPALVAACFGGATLGFCPRERRMVPATEADEWRGRVQGAVHDEKAYLMNGVAGHAGLFGSAGDVAALTDAYLAAANGRRQRLLSPALARLAIEQAAYDPILRRGLGWALKTSDDNSCGRLFGTASFGHTGFTGTCVWADPQRDLQAVLLTNAVYFGRSDSRPLRAAFFEAAVEASES
jgi:CubicO group peptidase (beta-lactamase class C family)